MPDVTCSKCGHDFFGYARDSYWPCPRCKAITWNRTALGYGQTRVSVQSSVREVLELFRKFSPIVTQAGVAQDHASGTQGVEFVVQTEPGRGFRGRFLVEGMGDEREQRQAWRLIVNWLKNTLLAVAFGALRAEEVFAGFAVSAELRGETLGRVIAARVGEGLPSLPGLQFEAELVALREPEE